MDLVAAWLVFPVVALIASAGAGLLVERAARSLLPGALLLPVGMAALLAVTQLTTYFDLTAELTIPLVVAVVAGGLFAGRGRLRELRPDRWALAAAAGVFAVFAAPIVLTGDATFAGYGVLGDTSVHLIGADQLLRTGRDFSSLDPSSYQFSLHVYFELAGYPAGAPGVAGSLSWLAGGQDVAWTFQPLLTLFVAFMALSLWSLLTPYVAPRPLRAALTFVAAQPALVLAYALQGSIKEIGTCFVLVTLVALVPWYARAAVQAAGRSPFLHALVTVPLAVTTAGGVGVVGLVFGLWAGPLVIGAMLAGLGLRPKALLAHGVVLGGVLAVLCYQSLIQLTRYVESNGEVASNQNEFGNLLQPLKAAQVLGIWITGEYRLPPPDHYGHTYVLIGVAVVGIVFGAIWIWRRGAWPFALWFAVALVAWVYIMRRGSPWADGKGLVITSPAALTAALLGVAGLWEARRRLEGIALGSLIAVGVLWSNALAYHDASPAPRDRLAELAQIGERFAGEGPTLYTEFEEFGKHFLRRTDPEGSAEGWQPRYLEAGTPVNLGVMRDLDVFAQDYVTHYKTIVLRRGPFGSRPPAIYRRVHAGLWYDVWQRSADPATLVEHLPVGGDREPAGEPDCERLRVLSRRAPRLAYVERALSWELSPVTAERPPAWFVDPTDGAVVHQVGPGVLRGSVATLPGGEFGVWLEGSFGREVEVYVDGNRVGSVENALNGRRASELVGTVTLDDGEHAIEVRRGGGNLEPANGGRNRLLGPVTLTSPDPGGLPVKTIDSGAYRTICGRPVDWVAAVR